MFSNKDFELSDLELERFSRFVEEHFKCSTDETLSSIYNIKLVFNIKENSIAIPTCLCSMCGEESALASADRYEKI